MSRLDQLLTSAMEMRAWEMWMAPGQPARVRIGREWKDLTSDPWTPNETKALLSSPLSEFDKREFFERGSWAGNLRILGRTLNLKLQITEQGIAGAFRWKGPEAFDFESWALPAHMLEVLTHTRGLTMVAGPASSGKSSLLFLLMQKLGQNPQQLVHYYSDLIHHEVPSRVSTFPLKSLSAAMRGPADVVIVDGAHHEQWTDLLDLAESGRHVILGTTSASLFSALERWNTFHERFGRSGLGSLQMGLGTRLVAGTEGRMVPAVELLLVTQKLRSELRNANWSAVEDEMRASGEKTGMRTLNQSLLQLLLRRKIEMRTAFQESPHPDEFDLLLKKVGI